MMKRRLGQRLWFSLGLVSALVIGTLLGTPPPAQAGIFDFLFGGRNASRGQATGRERGGAVRSGRSAGGNNPNLPYVLSPRNTYLPSSSFLIEWNPVPGATSYEVRLWRWADAYGERQWQVWEGQTTETSVAYEGSIPLDPARYYSIEVVAQTAKGQVSSDQDVGCDATGFTLLFPENVDFLNAELASTGTQNLSPEETALTLADIYFRYGLLAAAIESLKTPVGWEQSVPINLALGEIYSFAGLNGLSLARYQAVLSLASTPLEQAIAQEGIGTVNAVLLNLDQARVSLQEANRLYRVAGQTAATAAIDRRLRRLARFQQTAPNSSAQAAATTDCQTAASL